MDREKSDIHFFLPLLKRMTDILKFIDTPIIDECIEEYDYHEHEPITGTNLNNAIADEIALTNNAIMHLFNGIEYHLSNQLIESLNYPGQATIMLGLLKYPDDFSKARGLNQLCYKDTATTAARADNNGFSARLTLSHPVTNRQWYFFLAFH